MLIIFRDSTLGIGIFLSRMLAFSIWEVPVCDYAQKNLRTVFSIPCLPTMAKTCYNKRNFFNPWVLIILRLLICTWSLLVRFIAYFYVNIWKSF